MDISRRKFLGASASAVLVAGTMAKGPVFGANDRIRVACIGINGQGWGHVRGFSDQADSEVVAICDADRNVLAGRAAQLEEHSGRKPKTYVDMREVMADDDVDAVSFATPNHWHSLGTVWACQANKDVYVEKPLSHNVWEGRKVVEAARKYNRVVMHGTQNRSNPGWIRTMQRMRAGVIGDIYMARALCFKTRNSIGTGIEMPPPEHLDWNLWQGPAEERAYRDYEDKRGSHGIYVHYNWHWFWAYGNGDIGNQGVHQMDVACWGLNKGLPVKVTSLGGRYTYEDEAETPNTQIAQFQYADGSMLVFEVRGRATNDETGIRIGNLFYGSDGYAADVNLLNTENNVIQDDGSGKEPIEADGNHIATFLRAVRSRTVQDGQGSAMDGHISSAHCHLANVAYRMGGLIEFDPVNEVCVGPNAEAANALLRATYREPFVVPEEV